MNLKERLLVLFFPLTLLPLVFLTVIGFFLGGKISNLAALQPYVTSALVFISLVALAVVVMILATANSIAKPLKRLTENTRNIAKGNLEASVQVASGTWEIDHLSSAVEQMREEIKQNQTRLQEKAAHAALGRIAVQVAHDLASPLSSLEAALPYFRRPDFQTSEEGKKFCRLLEMSAKRLKAVSRELLDRRHGRTPRPTRFSLAEILDELAGEYQLQPAFHCVEFVKDYDGNPSVLGGDREKIQRAFANLIKNAAEAMDFCGTITLRIRTLSETIKVEVEDNGPGMTPEVLETVKKGGVSVGKKDGHGIGLSVVREAVEGHGGKWEVRSEEGVGTVFCLEFTPVPSEETNVPSPLALPAGRLVGEGQSEGDRGYKVLVIDDEPSIRLCWEVIAEKLHIETLHLFENLEALQNQTIDLKMIDIAFVDKNIEGSRHTGAEAVSYLKSQGVAKVVLASGESEKKLREDPSFDQVDFISQDKIPISFKPFFS